MPRLLIIGAGEAGVMVAREILDKPELAARYELAGFLDDDPNKTTALGHKVLGPVSLAPRVIREQGIQEAILAMPSAPRESVNRILLLLTRTGVRVRIVPALFEIIEGAVHFRQVRDVRPEDLLGREEVGFDESGLSTSYKDQTVFVTGAGGSIGSEIFTQLLALPVREAVAFGHGENSIASLIQKAGHDPRFRYCIGDVRDYTKLSAEMARFKPGLVFHAAAHKHVPLMEDYPDEAVKNNILGTWNAALSAMENGVKRFIFVSTDKAINPTSIMGATKRVAEKLILSLNARKSATRYTLTRFGNVLGSRGSVIPIFKEQIAAGGPVTVTHPEMTRFFMSIREAARLVIKSGALQSGHIFVLDMGKPVKILELARSLIGLAGYTEEEVPIKFTGLRPGEKLYEEVLTEDESLRKSAFDKLFVSSQDEAPLSEADAGHIVSAFRKAAEEMDHQAIRGLIREVVPEFQGSLS